MRLAVVACAHWRPGVCAAGRFGGIASVAHCAACPHYDGPAERFTGETVEGPDVTTAATYERADYSSICFERLTEEWRADWQAKLRAAGEIVGSRLYLPTPLYREALKHRR